MAGRPRTMLKRIAEWQKHADQLDVEIMDALPAGYFHYHFCVDMDKYADSGRLVDLDAIPNLDRVAFEWSLAGEAASELADHLRKLGLAIRQRLERKGVRLNASCAATKPGSDAYAGGDDSDDPKIPSDVGDASEK